MNKNVPSYSPTVTTGAADTLGLDAKLKEQDETRNQQMQKQQ